MKRFFSTLVTVFAALLAGRSAFLRYKAATIR